MKLSEHFVASEFACGCGCGYGISSGDVDSLLVSALEGIRVEYGYPMIITSGCRCEAHNTAVGGWKRSPHLIGKAADIELPAAGPQLQRLLRLLVSRFERFGIYRDFIHVDVASELRSPWAWMGK